MARRSQPTTVEYRVLALMSRGMSLRLEHADYMTYVLNGDGDFRVQDERVEARTARDLIRRFWIRETTFGIFQITVHGREALAQAAMRQSPPLCAAAAVAL